MLILVHGNGFSLERQLREDVQQKVDAGFARFSKKVVRVNVYLEDLNGPKKGIDKSIRLVIDIEREPKVVIEEKGERWAPLLESVIDRATQSLTQQIKRARARRNRTSMAGEGYALMLDHGAADDHAWKY
jgi:putative sigma-54 modulation protein